MQKQQKIILVIGVAAAVAALFMLNFYIDQQKRALKVQAKKEVEIMRANQTPVLVAAKNIPRGSMLEADMLTTQIVPNQFVQPQAATSLDRVSGMVAAGDIAEGEQITLSKLTRVKEISSGTSLAMVTPAGKRAVTVPIDGISSVGGMISPGDYVDVIATVPIPYRTPEGKQETTTTTVPIFQNVLVLAMDRDLVAVQQASGSQGRYKKPQEERREVSMITLALSPQEANFLAFVMEQQKIRLILRSPADSKIESVRPASWDTLLQYVMPEMFASPKQSEENKAKEQGRPGKTVEIIRGLKREIVPLTEAGK